MLFVVAATPIVFVPAPLTVTFPAVTRSPALLIVRLPPAPPPTANNCDGALPAPIPTLPAFVIRTRVKLLVMMFNGSFVSVPNKLLVPSTNVVLFPFNFQKILSDLSAAGEYFGVSEHV